MIPLTAFTSLATPLATPSTTSTPSTPLCVKNPIPYTITPCADWALLPQKTIPNVYGTCAPKDTILTQTYPEDDSFIAFLNLNSLCIEARADIYQIIKDFQAETYADLNLDTVQAADPPPLPAPMLKALLMGLKTKCLPVDPLLDALNSLLLDTAADATGSGSGSGSGSGPECTRQWYAIADLPVSDSYIEAISDDTSLPCTAKLSTDPGLDALPSGFCSVPRKVYTNCVTPPAPLEKKDTLHGLNKTNETYDSGLSLSFENPLLDSLAASICLDGLCNNKKISCFETGSGSGSGSGSDADSPIYCKAAVFEVSSYLQNKIWTLLLESLVSNDCPPWTALEFKYFNPDPGSGSGSGDEIGVDQFLGRLDYSRVFTYSQLQYETIGGTTCYANTNIFPKTSAYGPGNTSCKPFPLPIQPCAPLATFIAPAVESNPVLDFFPPKFWTEIRNATNGLINAYNYANTTEFVASEIEFFYPLTPLPFTIRLKATIWLPRPIGFVSVGFNARSIQNNFGEYIDKVVNVNYAVSQKSCLSEISL